MFGLSAAATGKNGASCAAIGPLLRTFRLRSSHARSADRREQVGVFGVNVGHLWDEIDRINGWLEALLELYRKGA